MALGLPLLLSNQTVLETIGPDFVAAATATGGGGTTATIAKPPGVTHGQFLLLVVALNDTNTTGFNLPSGWQHLNESPALTSGHRVAIAWKIAGTNEPAQWSVTWSGSSTWSAALIVAGAPQPSLASWLPPRDGTGKFRFARFGLTVGNDSDGNPMDYDTELAKLQAAPGLGAWRPLLAREFPRFNRSGAQIANLLTGYGNRGVGVWLSMAARLNNGDQVAYQDILNGVYDSTLIAQAQAIQQFINTTKRPVIWTFHHEAYAHVENHAPPGATKEEACVLYQRVYREKLVPILRLHAPDCGTVFHATEWQMQASQGGALATYPGGDWIDFVAFTGANAYDASEPSTWKTPTQRFEMARDFIEFAGKPVIIAAAGTAEDEVNSKPDWIADLATLAENEAEWIALVVYAHTKWADTGRDQRFDTSPESLAAMQALVADPVFSATIPSGSVNQVQPIAASDVVTSNVNTSNHTCPSLTAPTAHELAIRVAAADAATASQTYTWPASTRRADVSAASRPTISIATSKVDDAGLVPSETAVLSTSQESVRATILLTASPLNQVFSAPLLRVQPVLIPRVERGGAPQSFTVPLLSPLTLHQHTIVNPPAQTITAPVLEPVTFYEVVIVPPENAQQFFFAPVLKPVTLPAPTGIPPSQEFDTPVLKPVTVHTPAVIPPPQGVTAMLLMPVTFHEPSVTPPPAPQTITIPTLRPLAFHQPAVGKGDRPVRTPLDVEVVSDTRTFIRRL